jgi:hypothetical protein
MELSRLVATSLVTALGVAASVPASGTASHQSLQDAMKRHPHAITFLAVANGAASRDRMCYEEPPAWINQVAAVDASVGATQATVEVPMDNATSYVGCRPAPADPITYENTWIDALRSRGLHVWFRQQWNSWAGAYTSPMLTYATRPAIPYETRGGTGAVLNGTDKGSYLAKTYHYILSHPQFYASGDAFTPVGEPQDSGVGPAPCKCQFPNFAEMNRFLRDSITLDRYAFSQLGVNVLVGLDGTSCDFVDLEPATVAVMGVVGVDCYVPSAALLMKDLTFVHSAYHAPIVLSEWGAIYNNGEQPATSRSIDSIMQALMAAQFVVGFDYWQSYGGTTGENLVDPSTMGVSAAGRTLQQWFAYSLALGRRPGSVVTSADTATARMW